MKTITFTDDQYKALVTKITYLLNNSTTDDDRYHCEFCGNRANTHNSIVLHEPDCMGVILKDQLTK